MTLPLRIGNGTSTAFDASGEVYVKGIRYTFDGSASVGPHLDPLTQGYVEAALTEFWKSLNEQIHWSGHGAQEMSSPAFSDLAPEALERIIEDCAAFAKSYGYRAYMASSEEDSDEECAGGDFWRWRNGQRIPNTVRIAHLFRNVGAWSPLTPYLGDDGKVYLREGGQ